MANQNTKDLKTQTLELMRQYQRTRSTDIRNQLAVLNFGLVRKEVHYWVRQCVESYEDLVQVGCLGLIRAIERFDSSKGHAFSSFAMPYIRGEIQHYLRDKGAQVRVPRQWHDLWRQGTSVKKVLQAELNRTPTDREVASALGISLEDWQEAEAACHNCEPLSLDALVSSEDEGSACLGDLVPDSRYQSFQLAQEDRLRLQQALAKLEEKTRKILEFIFLYDLTQKETAEQLEISVVTVSRRMKKGLHSLRQFMDIPQENS